jgi:hypothetical protein
MIMSVPLKRGNTTTARLNWDMAPPPFTIFSGPVFERLGLRTFKWPGGHLLKIFRTSLLKMSICWPMSTTNY